MKNLSKTTKTLLFALAAILVATVSEMFGYSSIGAQAVQKGEEFMVEYHNAKAAEAVSGTAPVSATAL